MQNISLVLMSVSLWFTTGSAFAQQSKPNVSQCVSSAVTAQNVTHTSDKGRPRYVNNRTDNDLVATYGTCYLNDFRFFTMLHQDEWDLLRWETIGNAVMAHRTWRNWPYEQHLNVQVDGVNVLPGSMKVDEVEQQFDFRQDNRLIPAGKDQTAGSDDVSPSVDYCNSGYKSKEHNHRK